VGFYDYKRVVAEILSGEVYTFVEAAINGELKMPLKMDGSKFNEIPLMVGYRTKGDKRFAHLRAVAGHPHLVLGGYDVYIRG
jgi:hypothetical protein